jgi:hypothetical protein
MRSFAPVMSLEDAQSIRSYIVDRAMLLN